MRADRDGPVTRLGRELERRPSPLRCEVGRKAVGRGQTPIVEIPRPGAAGQATKPHFRRRAPGAVAARRILDFDAERKGKPGDAQPLPGGVDLVRLLGLLPGNEPILDLPGDDPPIGGIGAEQR